MAVIGLIAFGQYRTSKIIASRDLTRSSPVATCRVDAGAPKEPCLHNEG
jgi:hypothetical protein